MKKSLMTLAALSLMTGTPWARSIEIGIDTTQDANPENTSYNGAPGPFTAYVVCSGPVNDSTGGDIAVVGGFEFRIVVPASVFLLAADLPPRPPTSLPPHNYLCGTNLPVANGVATCVTLERRYLHRGPGHVLPDAGRGRSQRSPATWPSRTSMMISGSRGLPVLWRLRPARVRSLDLGRADRRCRLGRGEDSVPSTFYRSRDHQRPGPWPGPLASGAGNGASAGQARTLPGFHAVPPVRRPLRSAGAGKVDLPASSACPGWPGPVSSCATAPVAPVRPVGGGAPGDGRAPKDPGIRTRSGPQAEKWIFRERGNRK